LFFQSKQRPHQTIKNKALRSLSTKGSETKTKLSKTGREACFQPRKSLGELNSGQGRYTKKRLFRRIISGVY